MIPIPVSTIARRQGLRLLVLLSASATVSAASLAENPTLLKQRVAALFAGRYASASCYEQPNREGRPAAAGDLRITPDGQVVVGPERAALFDPAGELAFTLDLKARQLYLDVTAGDRMARLASTDDSFRQASIEIGHGAGNVTQGRSCGDLDVRGARIVAQPESAAALFAEVYDTGGQTVKGRCHTGRRSGGKDREASFNVSAKALVLNGRMLPWPAQGGALGMVSLGSRIADQQVNGGVEWLNGANFHAERQVGPGAPFVSFSFNEAGTDWACSPSH
ncbi:hypothetical protein [Ideonella oryzae]|uniref:FecR protein domain-containing protein n=1 Tax=Ideonella oryzae TaxID=2937441 RepID=A0ABT1BQR6_9BURK|nr:hypothetical protein [Ideonella oryzae]MCO5978564.1 hypothetical protein [Ideonella oryzae]